MKDKDLRKIEELAVDLFDKMSLDNVNLSCSRDGETVFLSVRSKEPRLLIGKRGETLRAIQRLLRIILLKEFEERFFLHLDVNDYRKKKKEYLEELADEVADEVSLVQEAKALPPMSSYERRIIHLALSERGDVVTESEGEEPRRRVVVKPS